MITKTDFENIKRSKEDGLTKGQTANRIGICYQTVSNYWEMSDSEFKERYNRIHQKDRGSVISLFKDEILEMLRESPGLRAIEIHKILKDRHGEAANFSERTSRNYVKKLREEYQIAKPGKEYLYTEYSNEDNPTIEFNSHKSRIEHKGN